MDFLTRRFGLLPDAVSFLCRSSRRRRGATFPAAVSVLEGFALASNELPQFNLLLDAPETARKAINEHAARLGVSPHVALVHPLDVPSTMQSAHVVWRWRSSGRSSEARQPNEICLKSLWQGKTLLAADIPRNRDASPEGRGCLWFEADNPRDLGYRMAFLGRKPEFSAALGAAGRMYIFETRSTAAVGQKYDEAYRYAASRRKSGGVGNESGAAGDGRKLGMTHCCRVFQGRKSAASAFALSCNPWTVVTPQCNSSRSRRCRPSSA